MRQEPGKVVLTSTKGNNSDLLASAFNLYVPDGSVVADVTFGKGVFWRNIDKTRYLPIISDKKPGFNIDARVDFRSLPYRDGSIDAVMFDPPYLSGGDTVVEHINKQYSCDARTSHQGIIRRYTAGIVECSRVLKKRGRIFIKCQDETVSGKQRFTHLELIKILEMLGYLILDLFILTTPATPCMRHNYQKSARKNHSYLIVAELRN